MGYRTVGRGATLEEHHRWCDREGQVNDIDDCRIHGCSTVLQVVAVVDALTPGLKASPAYVIARRERFPNSDDVVAASGARRALHSTHVAVCEECCRKRDTFLLTEYPRWSTTHALAS